MTRNRSKYILYSALLCLGAVLYLFISPWSSSSFTDTKDGEKYIASITDAVGSEKYYESLQLAIDEVNANETIVLLKNTAENISSVGRSYILDMGGHKIDGSGNGRVYNIDGGTVVIENGTLTNGVANGSSADDKVGGGLNIKNADVTLNGVTVSNSQAATFGGGIYFNGKSLSVNGSKILNNTASTSSGGGIYSKSGTIEVSDTEIIGNKAPTNQGGGIYAANITLSEVTFKENVSKRGGAALYLSRVVSATIDDCVFDSNEGTSAAEVNGSIIFAGHDLGNPCTVTFNRCQIFNNKNVENTVHFENNSEYWYFDYLTVKLNDCEIYGNKAYRTGGIRFYDYCNATLENVIVKDNKADGEGLGTARPAVGGISIHNSYDNSINIVSGAIYNNTADNGDANDLYIGNSVKIDVFAACNMVDEGFDFSNYVWMLSDSSFIRDNTKITGRFANEKYKHDILLTAFDPSNPTALYGGKLYDSIQKAIDAAKLANDINAEIKLLPGTDKDGNPTTYAFSTKMVTIDYPIQLDIGKCSLDTEDDTLFKIIGEGNSLILRGTASLHGLIELNNAGALILATDTESGLDIRLGDEKSALSIGDGFVKCGKLNIELDDDRAAELTTPNKGESDISRVIVSDAGDKFDLKKDVEITYGGKPIKTIYPIVTVSIEDNNIIAINPTVKSALYVSSKSGNNSNPGTLEQPLETIEDAIIKLKVQQVNGGTIYLVGTVTVDSTIWDSEGRNITIKRYSEQNAVAEEAKYMAVVNGSLTLRDITIDGSGDVYTNLGSMIKLSSGASLVLDNKATLTNNNITKSIMSSGYFPEHNDYAKYSGGAVYTYGGNITINSGAKISECTAMLGGGIYCENGKITMNGGTVEYNTAVGSLSVDDKDDPSAHYAACGGGIVITGGGSKCEMIMNGGEFRHNTANYGGGLSVGTGVYSILGSTGKTAKHIFTMYGGKFTDNTAISNGGGMFVQSTYRADLKAGSFVKNTCNGGGNYGGGAIYVNGGKEDYCDGELWIIKALIKDNQAKYYGGGIAGCGTSGTVVNAIDGSIIYGNESECYTGHYIPCDISSSTDAYRPDKFDGYKTQQTYDYFTQYMLDGTPYHWRFVEDNKPYTAGDYAPEAYMNSISGKALYTTETPQTSNPDIKVFITDNYSGSCGGGIGTNGSVFIGGKDYIPPAYYTPPVKFEVKKEWDNIYPNNPNYSNISQLNIWVLTVDENGTLLNKIHNPLIIRGQWQDKAEFGLLDKGFAIILEEVIYNNGLYVWGADPEARAKYGAIIEPAVKDIMKTNHNDANFIWSDSKISPFASSFAENGTDVEKNGGSFTVTNSLSYGDLTVSKTVTGALGDKGKAFTFTVTLGDITVNGTYGDMEFKDGKATFTLKHGESKTAKNLPAGIAYTVVEAEADRDNYITTSDHAKGNIPANGLIKVKFVNSMPEDVSVKKIWDDDDSEDRPESITVQLYCDGKPYGAAVVLKNENDWTYTWNNLISYHVWTVDEVNIPEGYSAAVTNTGNAWVIVNTKDAEQEQKPEPELTDVSVTKVWDDDNSTERPKSVTVQLYRSNKAYGEPVILNDDNDWNHTWNDLEAAYNWTVEESDVPEGYRASATNNGSNWTITNTKDKTDDTHHPSEDRDDTSNYSPNTGVGFIGLGVMFPVLSLIAVMAVKKKRG